LPLAVLLGAEGAKGDSIAMAGAYPEQLELGPCEIWFGTAGAELSIGAMVGGATLRGETLLADLKKDSFGDGIYDQQIVGANWTLEGNLGDLNMASLEDVIPGAVLTDDGLATPLQSKLSISVPVGTSLRDIAKSLILKRIISGEVSTDEDNWWTFPIAAVVSNVELVFDATTQRRIPITFRILPDPSTKLLGYKGYVAPA